MKTKTTRMTLSLEVYDRRIVEGALRYAVSAGVDIDLQQPAIMPWQREWSHWWPAQAWKGLILQVKLAEHLPLLSRALKDFSRPVVLLCARDFDSHHPQVAEDDYQAGRLAAEYFQHLKFQRFAIVGQNLDAGYSDRVRGFEDALGSNVLSLRRIIFQEARRHNPKLVWGEYLRQQLRDAEKPLAILALDDMNGDCVLYFCVEQGIAVPEEIAVLGVGNNDIICDYTHPPLSSIEMNGERIGWTATKLLHSLIEGGKPPAAPTVVHPLGVVERRSTEIFSAEDQRAVCALRYIWDHLHEPLKTADIARKVNLSRRNLNRIFMASFGRTVKAEQTRKRMLRIREMLAASDAPAKAIAQAVGFRTPEHMYRVFLAEHKMTMKQYCKKLGLRRSAPWATPPAHTGRLVTAKGEIEKPPSA